MYICRYLGAGDTVFSFLPGTPELGASAHHAPFPASHLRDQRLAAGSTAAPPQCEGCYGQDHDQEDASRDGGTVVAPLGAGLLHKVNRWLVWEGEEGQDQNEPSRGGKGGPQAGDSTQSWLSGGRGRRKGEGGPFRKLRPDSTGQLMSGSCWPAGLGSIVGRRAELGMERSGGQMWLQAPDDRRERVGALSPFGKRPPESQQEGHRP